MIFRQLFDNASSTYTYLLADESSHEAIIVAGGILRWKDEGLALNA